MVGNFIASGILQHEKNKAKVKQIPDVETSYVCFVYFSLEMYNKTIIEFGLCDMRNYQGLGKCYQPRLRLG